MKSIDIDRMYTIYAQYLTARRQSQKYRKLGHVGQANCSHTPLDFSTNDYLNLSRHTSVIDAGYQAAREYGFGATGSRLLSGNRLLYESCEEMIARDKGEESALIFSSGFQANLTILSCLLDVQVLKEKPLVFFDKANHASLYQAIFLSQAVLCRYRHNDMSHLSFLLKRYRDDCRPKFIVTETVFGMDGDIAHLEEIRDLAKVFNACLYLDEAHATGVFGMHGYGLSTSMDWQGVAHIVMGTLSKAVGVSGGYMAAHSLIRDLVINHGSGFIYSTAPSPAVVGAACRSWQLIKSLDAERLYLQDLSGRLRMMLSARGFDIGSSETHIIPIILGKESTCLRAQSCLLDQGIMVSCVRPPTVRPGTARLRIALTVQHTQTDIDCLIKALEMIERQ